MTAILLAIIWIGYGAFAAYQSRDHYGYDHGLYFLYITCSPIIFILKCLYGAFKTYNDD